MSIQRSVAQQNAEVLAEIRRASTSFTSGALPWFSHVLQSQNLNSKRGILARLASVPEQEGDEYGCLWLTNSGEFWEIEVMISRESGKVIEIESVENITPSILVSAHTPGTGKSFGYLALQVLKETYGG